MEEKDDLLRVGGERTSISEYCTTISGLGKAFRPHLLREVYVNKKSLHYVLGWRGMSCQRLV